MITLHERMLSEMPDMSSDLWALFFVIVFGALNLGLSSILSLAQLGPSYILSARDDWRDPTGAAGRVARAYRNWLENFAQFTAALFIVHASGLNGVLSVIGAWAFLLGRICYLPAYVFAPPGVRPLCWMTAQIGVIFILADIFVS